MEVLEYLNSLKPAAGFSFSPAILWSVFMFIFLIFTIFSVVIFYHWTKYDWDNTNVKKAAAIYFSVATLIFIGEIIVISLLG